MKFGIWWLRRDLRLADNPALQTALMACDRVLPVYIHAPEEEAPWAPGAASRWWLHHSLTALDAALRSLGSRLLIRHGPSAQALLHLVEETGAEQVFCSRLYEPVAMERDRQVAEALRQRGIGMVGGNAALLNEPWTVRKTDDTPYRVFTPYWKACQQAGLDRPLQPAPEALPPVSRKFSSVSIAELQLLPKPRWDDGLRETWQPGEDGAFEQLHRFMGKHLSRYPQQRDRPDEAGTSRLSPHLHFGEIGPRQIWHALQHEDTRSSRIRAATEAFVRQLGWREFSQQLLYHYPDTAEQPLDPRFRHMPWARDDQALQRWQHGSTGIPMVDAGMRELWHRGWMHNRVRMLCASFLTKNLRIPWQQGSRWFWDTLVDADLGNNTMGWQWTAGSGADAAPYFRIFNPVLQGRRFDPDGTYVRRWIPELAALPERYLHAPWEAPQRVLEQAGLQLGRDYPHPLVDLKASREQALAAYREIRGRA